MTETIDATPAGSSDFATLTGDQEMYRDTAARFARQVFPIPQLREAYGQPPSPEYLRRTGELGWYAGFVAESAGGGSVSGQPILDAVVLADVLGRSLQPAPVVATCPGSYAIEAWGADDIRPCCRAWHPVRRPPRPCLPTHRIAGIAEAR